MIGDIQDCLAAVEGLGDRPVVPGQEGIEDLPGADNFVRVVQRYGLYVDQKPDCLVIAPLSQKAGGLAEDLVAMCVVLVHLPSAAVMTVAAHLADAEIWLRLHTLNRAGAASGCPGPHHLPFRLLASPLGRC